MADTDLTIFKAEGGKAPFEDLCVENGARTWKEADLQSALGYSEGSSFRKTILRAMNACISTGISPEGDFILTDGGYKLTRFACYLIAMNADAKKPQVGLAQVYFAGLLSTVKSALEHAEGVERVAIRDDMTVGVKSLNSTAHKHGVTNFGFFQNAGYRGMYNMSLPQLQRVKGLPDGQTLFDRMGKVELAANLFRVTQTDERIRTRNINGQRPLENAAHEVGREVRSVMINNTGAKPEDLRLAAPIGEVKKSIKSASKELRELDGKTKKKTTPRI